MNSNPSSKNTLAEALKLLKVNENARATALLARLLRQEPDNEQAWHMLSYAVTDPEKKIYALRQVLKINPENWAAQSYLAQLSEAPPPSPPERRKVTATPAPAHSKPAPRPAPPRETPAPRPKAEWQARSREVWRAAAAKSAPAKILPFPGTETRSIVTHTPWPRLKIRARLTWRRARDSWAVFSQSRLAVLGLVILIVFALMAIAHPILIKTVWNRAVYDPITGFDMETFPHPSPPSPRHLLGTDTLGRDVLSRLLAATTPTFIIGLTAALATALIGTILSAVAAYFRGPTDVAITNLADVFLLFPAPVIMVVIGARFRDLGPVPLGLIYGFVTGAGGTALVMRSHALQVVSKPFMEAAHIAGGGALHIITKHLLPAMLPLAALQMMIAVTGAVVADGFISFFGITRTVSNWGTIIYDAFVYGGLGGNTEAGMWHLLLPAAICFSLFALGFYLVSRGLHRVAAPTIREERL